MLRSDRTLTEKMFLAGVVPVLCCTVGRLSQYTEMEKWKSYVPNRNSNNHCSSRWLMKVWNSLTIVWSNYMIIIISYKWHRCQHGLSRSQSGFLYGPRQHWLGVWTCQQGRDCWASCPGFIAFIDVCVEDFNDTVLHTRFDARSVIIKGTSIFDSQAGGYKALNVPDGLNLNDAFEWVWKIKIILMDILFLCVRKVG